jgi:hypothetical protein
MRPPVIEIGTVWHVGDLDPDSKCRNSYEGAGLSVSVHPAAWRMIARGQVAGTTWRLDRPGSRFLDALGLGRRRAAAILTWGEHKGYVQPAELWKWTYWDDDLDEEVHQILPTREEALAEADCDEDDDCLRAVQGHVSTPVLDALTMQDRPSYGTRNALDLLLPIYADRVLGLDGVWWAERLDPVCYSAPRGVIAAASVSRWKATSCRTDPDDEC